MAGAKGGFDGDTKALIWQRSKGRCDRCGLGVGESMHFHHRTPRRMGGTSRDDLSLPSNGLLLHPGCHDYIESKRKVAAQLGFLVGYGSEPRTVPIMTGWTGWVWLDKEGGYIKIDGVPPQSAMMPPDPPKGSGDAPLTPDERGVS